MMHGRILIEQGEQLFGNMDTLDNNYHRSSKTWDFPPAYHMSMTESSLSTIEIVRM